MVLNTLDDIILHGYGKVTYWAHKHLGKTKYDLAQVCDTGAALTLSGSGAYLSLIGYQTETPFLMINGGMAAFCGPLFYHSSKRKNKKQERRELQQLVNTGAAQAPSNSLQGIRPLGLAMGTLFLSLGITLFIYGAELPESAPATVTKEQYGTSAGLLSMTASTFHYCLTSASYFCDTTMFPPQKGRKPLLKRAIDYVTRPFRQKAPVPMPAEE